MRRLLMLVGCCLTIGLPKAIAQGQSTPFVVIVNAANPIESLTQDEVSDLFLKRTSRWRDGKTIVYPINLGGRSPTRVAFSKAIHGRSVSIINTYWQQQIFSGKATPPTELANEAAVVTFVRTNPGAISYVVTGTLLGSGVKVVVVTRR